MIPALDWYPAPFVPGGVEGQGVKRLLGSPQISPTSVLIRETAQNSWDARRGDGAVSFSVDHRTLDPAVVAFLRTGVLTGNRSGLGLDQVLARKRVRGLEISDRGTVGLGGPTRNDRTYPAGARTDFVNFVFNLGSAQTSASGGGSYGFGKSISYVASGCGTILIWSRSQEGGELQHRFIASAIGDVFDLRGRRYTGRHWWGRKAADAGQPERIEPIIGDAARQLGEALFSRTFRGRETGTSILILDPFPSQSSDNARVTAMSEAILWNLWPKMVPQEGTSEPPMSISLAIDGELQPLPNPSEHPVLKSYVRALQAVRAAQGGDGGIPSGVEVHEIRRYQEVVGHLGLIQSAAPLNEPPRTDESGFSGVARHVALMRHTAELVVAYKDQAPAPEGFQLAGVFRPVKEVDAAFRAAEPPAHDDWAPMSVEDKTQRSVVTVALRRIKDAAAMAADTARGEQRRSEVASGAHLGDALADLVSGAPAEKPSLRKPGGGGGSGTPAKAKIVGARVFALESGDRLHEVEVNHSGSGPLSVDIKLAVDGPSLPTSEARVLGWSDQPVTDPEMSSLPGSADRYAPSRDQGPVWLLVRAPDGVALSVHLREEQAVSA